MEKAKLRETVSGRFMEWITSDNNTGRRKHIPKSLSPERGRGRWRVSVTEMGEQRRGTPGEDSEYNYVWAEFR